MSTPIEFGTDGWRAIIAEDFTFPNVRAVALSAARFLKSSGLAGRGLVVGYDTRFGSDRFAEAVAEVVTAAGVPVALSDCFCPTPAVSYNVLLRKAGGAIVVTSSHNPASWNGIKYKPDYAGSASPEVVAALEAPLDEILAGEVPRMSLDTAAKLELLQTLRRPHSVPAATGRARRARRLEEGRAADRRRFHVRRRSGLSRRVARRRSQHDYGAPRRGESAISPRFMLRSRSRAISVR